MSQVGKGVLAQRIGLGTLAGVVISVSTGFVLALVGVDGVISFLCSMGGLTITLLLHVLSKIRESELAIVSALPTDLAIARDHFLAGTIPAIVDNFIQVRRVDEVLFRRHAEQMISNCTDLIAGLADGRMVVPYEETRIMYGDKPEKSVKVLECFNPEFWSMPAGRKIIQGNERALGRNVRIIHIWTDLNGSLEKHREILVTLRNIGVDVRILRCEVPHTMLKPYRIIDDKKVVELKASISRMEREQHIIVNQRYVEKTVLEFERLLAHSETFDEVFGESSRVAGGHAEAESRELH